MLWQALILSGLVSQLPCWPSKTVVDSAVVLAEIRIGRPVYYTKTCLQGQRIPKVFTLNFENKVTGRKWSIGHAAHYILFTKA